MDDRPVREGKEQLVYIPAGPVTLEGSLFIPEWARGIIVFAHGSGSSRHSPRNRYVAATLHQANFATLLIDLLTYSEEAAEDQTRQLRFDVGLMAERLVAVTDWLGVQAGTQGLRVGYFGASTGAGAALVAATRRPAEVAAIVSRGGRPDLAGTALAEVRAPTLLIVGGEDPQVIALNKQALSQLNVEKRLEIIPGASHLFQEQGTLEEVARLARNWFRRYLLVSEG